MKYIYEYEFPQSKTKLKFREFTTEEQLYIAKARLIHDDKLNYFNYIKSIFENCIENKEEISNLTMIEFLMFVLKIRILSVGGKFKIFTQQEEQSVTIEKELKDVLSKIASNPYEKDIEVDNLQIKLGIPKIFLVEKLINSKNNYLSFVEILKHFICEIGGIGISKFSDKEMDKIYEKISYKTLKAIEEEILKFITEINTIEVFDDSILGEMRLNFFGDSYYEMLKLINLYDIKNIQEEIFVLAELNPLYLMQISPIQRAIYLAIKSSRQQKSSEPAQNNDFLDFDQNQNNY